MKVAVMYSGGKDSNAAVEYAQGMGWEISYLLSVKPSTKECYLFHFATVEHTPLQASLLGLRHILVPCDAIGAEDEAQIVYDIVKKNPVDLVLLGGVGLQETQLRTLQNVLRPLGVEVSAAHAGMEHAALVEDLVKRGYEIIITQIASDGMKAWLGKTLTGENFKDLERDSKKYGFHIGFEGGYADTFVLSAPMMKGRILPGEIRLVFDDDYCGHVEFLAPSIAKMAVLKKN